MCVKADCEAQPMIQRQDELRQMRKASEKSQRIISWNKPSKMQKQSPDSEAVSHRHRAFGDTQLSHGNFTLEPVYKIIEI